MKELRVDATVENIEKVTAFVDEQLTQLNCPMKEQMQINIAIDELSVLTSCKSLFLWW